MRTIALAVVLAAGCGGSSLDLSCFPFGCPVEPLPERPDGVVGVRLGAIPELFFVSTNETAGGPPLVSPAKVVADPVLDVAYVWRPDEQQILAIDLATGARTIVSDAARGTGPQLKDVRGMTVDGTGGRLFAADRILDAVLAIDLATGDRSLVSAQGPPFSRVGPIVHDTSSGHIFAAAESEPGVLVEIDPATGGHVALRGQEIEGGPQTGGSMPVASALAVLPAERRLLVLKDGSPNDQILEVDLDDPTPRLWTDGKMGTVPFAPQMSGLAVDGPGGRIFTVSYDAVAGDAVIAIDLATRERTAIAYGVDPPYPDFFGGSASIAFHEGLNLILVAHR